MSASLTDSAPLLSVAGLVKAFPGVLAIRSATLDVRAGEIHALVGENGAGKSTLIKIVTGAHIPDAGVFRLSGEPARVSGPQDAFSLGVAAIYQELNLVPSLTVRENLFLGREHARYGRIDIREEQRTARELLAFLSAGIDPEARVRDLTVAQQQLVEIGRALRADARLLIMDEPTATLAPREVDRLFAILADLKNAGRGILFVTHRIDEIFRIADRVTIMRDGVTLGTWPVADLVRDRLIELMVGRPLDEEFPKARAVTEDVVLEVRDLWGGPVRGASLQVRRGEVVGIAGLVGSGRTELARLIFGADVAAGGTVLLNGSPVVIRSPRDAIEHGICLLTEDRKTQGLLLGLSAQENFALPNLDRWSRHGWIDVGTEREAFLHAVEGLRIRVTGPDQRAEHLSGGNQQKLLVARWLERHAQVVIFDEPTRGIDVGAKYEMYLLINELVAQGAAVVMISSELPEILGMSDRIIVMHDGRITGELPDASRATQEQVMELATQ